MFKNVYTKISPLADHAFFALIFQIQIWKYDINLTWLIYFYVHKNDISQIRLKRIFCADESRLQCTMTLIAQPYPMLHNV